jgi:hypothetical protein
MYRIPSQTNQFLQSAGSDLLGNVHYTKNMNFSEQGYAKLSSRTVAIQSEKTNSNFDIPISLGRNSSGWNVVTPKNPWIFTLSTLGIGSAQDTDTNAGAFALGFDSSGIWYQNRWYAAGNTAIYYKTGTLWTDSTMTVTSGYAHPMEILKNANTICIGNGPAVKQYSSSHSATGLGQLVIPSDFEVIGLSYSNNKLGVATRLSDGAAGQNQEAYFFVWDGASSTANQGFPVGSDAILDVTAYKSSWVILTRRGDLLYFNGGGFVTLATLPYAYFSRILGDSTNRTAYGDILITEGDFIYINASNGLNSYGLKNEIYLENYPSGVLCYDPNIGIYHKYSGTISSIVQDTVTAGNVNTTTDILITNTASVPETGNQAMLIFDSLNPIGGLVGGKAYYVIKVSPTSFKLATTYQNAINNVWVDITSTGASVNTFTFLTVRDFGLSLCQNRLGGIGIVETNNQVYNHLLFGGEYEDYATNTNYATSVLTAPQFPNKGYLVTSKFNANGVQDVYKKLYVKYRPMKSGDSLVIKYKDKDVLGIPVSTPQIPNLYVCNWTSANTLTTQADISEAYTYLQTTGNSLECEIINGAGAGSMPQVTSIAYNAGVYTITLDESVIGAANTYYCNIILNNWKVLGTIDSTDINSFKEFPIALSSKWCKIKVVFTGVETTLEELSLINGNFLENK